MTNGLTETNAEGPNPLDDAFETIAETLAFTFHKYKEAGLRELLATLAANLANCTRERLEEAADELNAAGLRKAASIVLETAATSRCEADLCPYEPGSHNATCWHRSLKRRQRKCELKRAKKKAPP
jgi:hypothetical protein